MKLEIGKTYQTRDDRKAYCVGHRLDNRPIMEVEGSLHTYHSQQYCLQGNSKMDIISEWEESEPSIKSKDYYYESGFNEKHEVVFRKVFKEPKPEKRLYVYKWECGKVQMLDSKQPFGAGDRYLGYIPIVED